MKHAEQVRVGLFPGSKVSPAVSTPAFPLLNLQSSVLGRLKQAARASQTPLFVRRSAAELRAHDPVWRESLERCIRPFHAVLSLLGGLPLTFTPAGEPTFRLWSPIVAYSVILYAYILYAIFAVLDKLIKFTPDTAVDELLASAKFVVYFLKNALIPFFMWLPVLKVKDHHQRIIVFHESFWRATRQRLHFEFGKYVIFYAMAIPVISAIASGVWVYWLEFDNLWVAPVFMVPMATSLTLDGLWCVSHIILGLMAQQCTASLKQCLQRSRGDAAAQKLIVREHRELWLQLSGLLQSNNDLANVTMSYHVLHVFVMLTLLMYALLSGLRAPWSGMQTVRAASTLFYLFELWLVANSAHFAATKFDEIQLDSYLLTLDNDTPQGVRKEVWLLLEVAAAAPRTVNMGGYILIDRSWLINMLGKLLSSLIILLQFKFQAETGGPKNDASPRTL